MSQFPDEPVEATVVPTEKKSSSTLLILLVMAVVGGFVAICVIGVLIALLLPAVQAAREAARMGVCSNNMKQIGLALHNYHDTYGSFPPAYLTDENGQPMHSWRVLILPFLAEQALYDEYDMNEPWDGPNNRRLLERMPAVYSCPTSAGDVSEGETSYAVVSGPDCIFDGEQVTSYRDVTDGLSNTILVVEAPSRGFEWLAPFDVTYDEVLQGTDGIQMVHPSGLNVLMGDASVQRFPADAAAASFSNQFTKSGGD